ncbi:TnsA endonuclease N-terminal domain-containing protein [Pseudidiomarina planktonica]|nr:TnsA endonuclease N-terminal domain-containing protein [Pseudidiomarina planktonica]RUO66244.1 hypothetical protein CWI77_07435 [Pseudidiomarina planktonica]
MQMEFDANVAKVVSQPIELSYIDMSGRRQRYTPDYLVYFRSSNVKPWLVEVKERDEIKKDFGKLRLKFAAGFAEAKKQGWIFKICDDMRIRGLRLENIRKLKNFSSHSVSAELREKLLTSLATINTPSTVQAFLESYTNNRNDYLTNISRIWWLTLQHDIELDLSTPLSEKTIILKVKSND